MKPVILLCGKAGVGKDTLADHIISKIPNSRKIAHSDPMKELGMCTFGFTQKQMFGSSEMRNKPDLRFADPLAFLDIRVDVDGLSNATRKALSPLARGRSLHKMVSDFSNNLFHKMHKQKAILSPRIFLQEFGTEFARKIDPDVWTKAIIDRAYSGSFDLTVITDGRFRNEISNARKNGIPSILIKSSSSLTSSHQSESELDKIPDYWFDRIQTNYKTHDGLEIYLEQGMQLVFSL